MPSQTHHDSYYDEKREALKREFIRKRRKKKKLYALCLRCMGVLAMVLLFCLLIYGIIYLRDKSNAKKIFVDCPDTGIQITLVENVFAAETEDEAFFEIDESKQDEKTDSRKNKYANVIPGSKGLVIVDAGHGGYDGGADDNGVVEKDINLSISYKLRDELEMRGYSVYLTRPNDEFVGLTQRASLANSLDNPLCLISVHQNSVDDASSVCGIEAWTYDRAGCTELGDAVCEGASKATRAQNRGTNYRTNLVVTSKTTMPAIIIECGYLTNPDEAAKLCTEEYQNKLAIGITDGIEAFTGSYYQ